MTAHQVFLAVTDPAFHVRIDGSGMLQNADGPRQLKAAGDTFDIEMDRQALGDVVGAEWLPRYYTIRNFVTRIVPDRLVEWAPALHREPRENANPGLNPGGRTASPHQPTSNHRGCGMILIERRVDD